MLSAFMHRVAVYLGVVWETRRDRRERQARLAAHRAPVSMRVRAAAVLLVGVLAGLAMVVGDGRALTFEHFATDGLPYGLVLSLLVLASNELRLHRRDRGRLIRSSWTAGASREPARSTTTVHVPRLSDSAGLSHHSETGRASQWRHAA